MVHDQSYYFQNLFWCSNRLLSKLASSDEVPGVFVAQRLSVYLILDDASTEATPQFASEVEFRKKSNVIPSSPT